MLIDAGQLRRRTDRVRFGTVPWSWFPGEGRRSGFDSRVRQGRRSSAPGFESRDGAIVIPRSADHVQDTWANFDALAPVIDRRFAEWRRSRR